MFSTFVGLGRFINCQRPEYSTVGIGWQYDELSLEIYFSHCSKYKYPYN